MYASVWSLRSDRYHYKLQESAKNVCSSTKMPSASGGFAPWPPTGGSAPGTTLGAPPPDPRYRLALPRSPYQPTPPTSNYFRRPWEAQYGFVDGVLWQLVPYQLQNFLELIDVLWLGLKWLIAFKHSCPDMVAQRVEVRWVRRPFIFTNEFTAVGSNPVLSQLCRVCRVER